MLTLYKNKLRIDNSLQQILIKIIHIYKSLSLPGLGHGIFWMIMASIVSNSNDLIIKILGETFAPFQLTFLRFFTGAILLVPFILKQGTANLKTNNLGYQITRSVLLFVAIALWCYGASKVQLTLVTTLSFTVPLFVLPLAALILKEKVGIQRWVATLAGFSGIVAIAHPSGTNEIVPVLALAMSCVFFACLDVINKKILIKESMLNMLFYSACGTALISLPFALYIWVELSLSDYLYLIVLGIGSNLILFFILKAFSCTEVSSLSPFRYTELIVSAFMGYIIFNEIPSSALIIGAIIIICSTLFISYYEANKARLVGQN